MSNALKQRWVQCELKSGSLSTVCWLPTNKPFKVGDSVTLKNHSDPERLWEVMTRGMETERGNIKKGDVFDSIKPRKL